MVKLLVLADDLTGALDSGVQLAHKGKQVKVIIYNRYSEYPCLEDMDVLVIDTETRHISSEEAYKCIFDILSDNKLSSIEKIYKKTDSALRGNIGAEISATMDALNIETVSFIPAYPKLGRTTEKGVHYIYGIELAKSVFSKDIREPVKESHIKKILEKQTGKKIILSPNYGCDEKGIIVYDCKNEVDLKNIYTSLKKNGSLKLVAGCAGFMEMYGNDVDNCDLCETKKKFSDDLTVICGTTNPISQIQLDEAEKNGACYLKIDMEETMNDPYWKNKLDTIIDKTFEIENTHSIRIIGPEPGTRKYSNMETKVSCGFGYIAKSIMSKKHSGNLMVIGGDTLLAVMNHLDVNYLTPLYEIQPGVVVSKFYLNQEEHYLISKSGGFGEPDLLVNI